MTAKEQPLLPRPERMAVELDRAEIEALLPEYCIPAGTSQAIEARRKLRAALMDCGAVSARG